MSPPPVQRAGPIEAKVKASTTMATIVGLVIAINNLFVGDSSLLGHLPAWLQFVLVTIVPGLVTFAGGYNAPHTGSK